MHVDAAEHVEASGGVGCGWRGEGFWASAEDAEREKGDGLGFGVRSRFLKEV